MRNEAAFQHLIGQQIGPNLICGILGAGGMGVVLRARHLNMERDVAVKLLDAGLFLADPESRARFLQEARVVARLRHPGLLGILDAGEHEGNVWFSMDLVEGRTLDEALPQLSFEEAAALLAQVAETLDYVHGEGLIHRDIKPTNIMIDGEGRTQLMDFGIVKDTSAHGGLTAVGSLLGTPAFMSPEQAGGETELVDARTDIYALGGILYMKLAGRPPYEGKNSLSVVINVIKRPPPPPSRFNESAPAGLEAICLKAMAREPEDRYATAGELARKLQAYAGVEAREDERECTLENPQLGRFGLRPGQTLSIGREPGNEIFIRSPAVSRVHARIDWKAGRESVPVITDNGSSNGTTLDGERVTRPTRLKRECQVGIGEFLFDVRVRLWGGNALLEDTEDDEKITGIFNFGESLSGKLVDAFSVHGLLRHVEASGLTGSLRFETPRGEATVTLGMGRIMAVKAPGLQGLEALDWIVESRRGDFRFSPDLEPCESMLDMSFSKYAKAKLKARREKAAERFERSAEPVAGAVPAGATQVLPPAEMPEPELAEPPRGGPAGWLFCPPFDPLPVTGEPLLLGRDETCALVLPHVCVSFEHALVSVEGGEMVVEDRSMYGTYVNGERVMLSTLLPGDTLTVGPYDIQISESAPRAREKAPVQPMRVFPVSKAMGGRLDRVSLGKILSRLESRGVTGVLEVSSKERSGVLNILGGRAVHAELGDLGDEEAIAAMLSLEKGKFTFQAKRKIREKTMSAKLGDLLARAQD